MHKDKSVFTLFLFELVCIKYLNLFHIVNSQEHFFRQLQLIDFQTLPFKSVQS